MHVYACLQFIHLKYNTKYTQNEFTRKGAFRTFPVTYLGRTEQTGSFCMSAGTHMLAVGHYMLILHGMVIIIIYLLYERYLQSYTLSKTLFLEYITLQRFCRYKV